MEKIFKRKDIRHSHAYGEGLSSNVIFRSFEIRSFIRFYAELFRNMYIFQKKLFHRVGGELKHENLVSNSKIDYPTKGER